MEAYVRFVRERSLTEAVASSLTELFAPAIHEERISGMLQHYRFIDERVLAYFRRRLSQANRVAEAQLDALHHAYVAPGLPPPGAFRLWPSQATRATQIPCARRARIIHCLPD